VIKTGDSSWFKKAVSAIVLVCFSITSISTAHAQNQISYDPSIHNSLDPDKYRLRPDELSDEEIQEAKRFLDKPTQSTLEIMFLLKNLHYRIQMEEEKLGTEAIAKILSKRKDSENIEVEIEKVGKAEPIVINTERGPLFITKVRHNGLKMSILFVDKNQIDLQLLEETERINKLSPEQKEILFKGFTPEQRASELAHRKLLLNHMRTLYARMLMSEWNPQLKYTPLSEVLDESRQTQENVLPKNVDSRVKAALNSPISDLKKEGWFKRVSSKTYETWVDLAKQKVSKTRDGNQDLMIVLYDGQSGENVETTTISRRSKFTYAYWKTYWKAIWERPAYSEEIGNAKRVLEK